MPGARLIGRNDHVAMPWRNGGGVTFEIARGPATGALFDWRLSLATIERGGPFSNFAGYQRAIAFVSGSGCILSGIEARPLLLDAPGQFAIFPGAAQVTSDLIAGPCCDFNLMVREPGRILSVKHLHATTGEGDPFAADHHNAVFCLRGTWECMNAVDGQRIPMQLHDTLILHPSGTARWSVHAQDPGAMALICTWEADR